MLQHRQGETLILRLNHFLHLIMTISIKIKNLKAKRILEDLASLDLIEITEESKTSTKIKSKEKTLTHVASKQSLAKTWNNAKEDKAWQDL